MGGIEYDSSGEVGDLQAEVGPAIRPANRAPVESSHVNAILPLKLLNEGMIAGMDFLDHHERPSGAPRGEPGKNHFLEDLLFSFSGMLAESINHNVHLGPAIPIRRVRTACNRVVNAFLHALSVLQKLEQLSRAQVIDLTSIKRRKRFRLGQAVVTAERAVAGSP